MTFSLVLAEDTQRLCRDIREWSVNEARPLAREIDRTTVIPEAAAKVMANCPIDASPVFIGERGAAVLGDRAPVLKAGETEGNWVLAAAVASAMAYGDPWVLSRTRGSGIGAKVVTLMGTPEQIDRWVGGIERGEYRRASFALTEPHFGSDASQVATTAVRDGDTWILNGTKVFCSEGAQADYTIVFATVDKSLGSNGIRAFVVEKDTPGFTIAKADEDKLGIRYHHTAELLFEDATLPLLNCLGDSDAPPKGGYMGALATLNTSRPIVSMSGLTIGQAAIDYAADWLRQRRASFTAHRSSRVEEEIARINAALAEARDVVYLAAWMQDQGIPNRKVASAAKAMAPVAEQACMRAVQLMGPEGLSEDHLVEKWCRDVKIYDIYEGSGQIQRITMSRQLYGRDASRA